MAKNKKVLIIGAGTAGFILKKDIEENYNNIEIVGFIDDDPENKDKSVLGGIADAPQIIKDFSIDEIVIAIPSSDGELIRKILLVNESSRIPIKIVPRDQRIISFNDVKYDDVKDLSFEDFLGRPFVKKDVQDLNRFYKGKKIIITGGAGSIGSEIVRQLLTLDIKKVVIYDNSEYLNFNLDQKLREQGFGNEKYHLVIGNILDREKFNRLVADEKPDLIFHAAAYKHVYLMEDNPDEAIINNVIGTKNIVDTAIKNNVEHFVFISTDKVVNPTSIMGSTKKLGEYYINEVGKESKTKFTVVRFGNVINSNGSVLPLFERQIQDNGYVTVTHKEVRRYFMSIREASHLVITSASNDTKGNIYVLNMGDLINIYEVAKCLIRSRGLIPEEDVDIRFIGLKKGEKLIEELYTDNEKDSMMKTGIENIFCVKNFEKYDGSIVSDINHLYDLAHNGNKLGVIKKLKRIFPSLRVSI